MKHELMDMGLSTVCLSCGKTEDRNFPWDADECSGIKPASEPLAVQEPLKPRNTGLKMSDNVDTAGGVDGPVGVDGADLAPELETGRWDGGYGLPPDYTPPPPEDGKALQFTFERSVPTANTILQDAQQHLLDRAAVRDQASERSMERAVRAYNAITGHELSERDGWMFMVVLKATRACTTPAGIPDDYEDLVAYGALAGESAGKA